MLNNEGVWRAGEKNSHVASRCLYQSIFIMTRFECQCSVQPITTFERAFLDANHVFHVNRDRFFVTRYKCNFRNFQHEDECVQNVLDVVISDRSWFKQDTRAQKTEIVRRKLTKTRECWRKPILSFFFSRNSPNGSVFGYFPIVGKLKHCDWKMALQTPWNSLVFEITSRKQTIIGMLGLHRFKETMFWTPFLPRTQFLRPSDPSYITFLIAATQKRDVLTGQWS